MNKYISCYLFSVFIFLSYAMPSMAALSVDRTRIVFNATEKAVSLNVTNNNPADPYLVQSWIEDQAGKKVASPLVAVPPLQRIEAGSKTRVRIQKLSQVDALPADRESVFWFNLREIPPASDKKNVLMLALQTRLKIFWRPESLRITSEKSYVPGMEQVVLTHAERGWQLDNPTGYYLTFVKFMTSPTVPTEKHFEPVMIAPFSRQDIKLPVPLNTTDPVLVFVNDYGSQQAMLLKCQAQSKCVVDKIIAEKKMGLPE